MNPHHLTLNLALVSGIFLLSLCISLLRELLAQTLAQVETWSKPPPRRVPAKDAPPQQKEPISMFIARCCLSIFNALSLCSLSIYRSSLPLVDSQWPHHPIPSLFSLDIAIFSLSLAYYLSDMDYIILNTLATEKIFLYHHVAVGTVFGFLLLIQSPHLLSFVYPFLLLAECTNPLQQLWSILLRVWSLDKRLQSTPFALLSTIFTCAFLFLRCYVGPLYIYQHWRSGEVELVWKEFAATPSQTLLLFSFLFMVLLSFSEVPTPARLVGFLAGTAIGVSHFSDFDPFLTFGLALSWFLFFQTQCLVLVLGGFLWSVPLSRGFISYWCKRLGVSPRPTKG